MSKVLVFSDAHAHNFSQFDTDGSRLLNCERVIADMFKSAAYHECRTIAFCGDLTDKVNSIPIKVALMLVNIFKAAFTKYPDIDVVAISGNHDLGERSYLHNSHNLASTINLLHDIFPNRFVCIDRDYYTLNEVRFIGIPYLEHKEHFSKALDEAVGMVSQNHPNILLIHQTPYIDGGLIPPDIHCTDERFNNFTHIFCGHIHKALRLTNNFTLVGNPIQIDFDDGGEHKQNGFWIFNTKGEQNTFYPLKYPRFIRIPEGSEVPAKFKNDYVQFVPVVGMAKEADYFENFDRSQDKVTLIKNYCEKLGIDNQDVIDTGVKIIKKL